MNRYFSIAGGIYFYISIFTAYSHEFESQLKIIPPLSPNEAPLNFSLGDGQGESAMTNALLLDFKNQTLSNNNYETTLLSVHHQAQSLNQSTKLVILNALHGSHLPELLQFIQKIENQTSSSPQKMYLIQSKKTKNDPKKMNTLYVMTDEPTSTFQTITFEI